MPERTKLCVSIVIGLVGSRNAVLVTVKLLSSVIVALASGSAFAAVTALRNSVSLLTV